MNIPLSWLKEYVDIEMPLEELASVLTMLGLEVDGVRLVGLPGPQSEEHGFKFSGITWDREKIVVAQIDEVMPHPNADRLTLCKLQDGTREHIVLTGAPNLYEFKGAGPLPKPLKVAYAKEGAAIYDGHQPGQVLTTLKRAKIRGVESYSMVASEKELGISDEHEGIIILPDDAPTGMPLVDYMGDAVFEISILPNMIRNASVVGVAREVAAATGKPLRKPAPRIAPTGKPVDGLASIEIRAPELNPRFVAGLVRGVEPRPSPYPVQVRLRLAGMRPINSIVDATNYVMLELGQPLHAFDYDELQRRAGGKAPTIITRTAAPGETLTTLDDVQRKLDDFTVVVADTAGSLSIAGVMGGQESEVTANTRNILLEGAAWNFINIRKTVAAQKLNSEAAYRFARGVHPALAEDGVRLCLDRIAEWSGGEIAPGLVDNYPLPARDPLVTITESDVQRLIGVHIPAAQIAELLTRLEFRCEVNGDSVSAQTPPLRLDIGEGVIGKADLIEEVARLYGYNNVPATLLADALPQQRRNPLLDAEENLRDVLAELGLMEAITHRQTSPEREARALPLSVAAQDVPYVRLLNPISSDRTVMRRSLMVSVLEVLERNIRQRERLAFFEIGPVFLPDPEQVLPAEPLHLAIALSGLRLESSWDRPVKDHFDFFDLKGILEEALTGLHLSNISVAPAEHPSFHPGKCAYLLVDGRPVGVFGELHPLVKERFAFGPAAVLAAEIDLSGVLPLVQERFRVSPVPAFPPVLEDIAVIVDEDLPAGRLEEVIRQAGGKMLAGLRLFDVFRGPQIGAGKKSLAYGLTYQSAERTLTDADAAQIRQRIIRRLEQELGAKLRS